MIGPHYIYIYLFIYLLFLLFEVNFLIFMDQDTQH
jgi:hypothetical protein